MREIVKKFKTLPKTSIAIAGIGILSIVLISAVLILNMQPIKPKIELKKETFPVEYGEPIALEAKDYIKANKDVLKETNINIFNAHVTHEDDIYYLNIGTYNAKVTYKNETLRFEIKVQDTTAPKFVDFKETIEVKKDNTDFDFVAQYKAEDLSEVTISVNTTKVDFSKVGEYKITVKAIDEYKNTTSKVATVKIVEETETELQ